MKKHQRQRLSSVRLAPARQRAIEAMEPRMLMSGTVVLLNEIEANPPGTSDNRYEYVELSGAPGQSLNGDYFVTFDGSQGNTGDADLVVNLSGFLLGSDGLLVIQNSAGAGHAIPTGTSLVSNPAFFTQSGGFLNGSLSFFLFSSPSVAFTVGKDYDTNDDGTLDHLPTGAVVLDSIANPDTNNQHDIVYGGVTAVEQATQNLGTADAMTRFPGNTATASAAWYGGELVDTNNVASQINYDPTRQAANEPAGAELTPGAANFPQSVITTTTIASNTPNPSTTAQPVTFSVSVTGGMPDGEAVTLEDVTNANSPVSLPATGGILAGGSATLTVAAGTMSVGVHDIIALYGGDQAFAASQSAQVAQVVKVNPPEVTNVAFSSSGWSSAFPDFGGYSIPTGASQAADLPWINLDTIAITFNQAVTVTQNSLGIAGINNAGYSSSGFAYTAETFTAAWTFASAFPADRLVLALASTGMNAVTAGGAALDGEWTNEVSSFPCGNSTPGGNFDFTVNILPGDVDNNGSVNIVDTIATRNLQFNSAGSANYSIFFDVDGTGSISIVDTIDVRNHQFTSLPAGTPTLPISGGITLQPSQKIPDTPLLIVPITRIAPPMPAKTIAGSTISPITPDSYAKKLAVGAATVTSPADSSAATKKLPAGIPPVLIRE